MRHWGPSSAARMGKERALRLEHLWGIWEIATQENTLVMLVHGKLASSLWFICKYNSFLIQNN